MKKVLCLLSILSFSIVAQEGKEKKQESGWKRTWAYVKERLPKPEQLEHAEEFVFVDDSLKAAEPLQQISNILEKFERRLVERNLSQQKITELIFFVRSKTKMPLVQSTLAKTKFGSMTKIKHTPKKWSDSYALFYSTKPFFKSKL